MPRNGSIIVLDGLHLGELEAMVTLMKLRLGIVKARNVECVLLNLLSPLHRPLAILVVFSGVATSGGVVVSHAVFGALAPCIIL